MNTAMICGSGAPLQRATATSGPNTPALWQTLRFLRRPAEFLLDCHRQYGDSFAVRWPGSRRHLLFASPRALQQVLTASEDTLCAASEYATFLPFLSKWSAMRSPAHDRQQQKRALVAAFNDDSHDAYVERAAAKSRAMAAAFPQGKAFHVDKHVDALAADLAVEIVLGKTECDTAAALKRSLIRAVNAYGPVLFACRGFNLPWARIGPWTAFDRISHCVAELAAPAVARSTSVTSADCIAAKYAQIGANLGVSTASILGDLTMITMACYIALATRTKLAIHVLASEPGVQSRLREEADGAKTSAYFNAVQNELLRLFPNNPLQPRRAMTDWEIDGQEVNAGDTVAVCTFLAHRRADTFADPHVFRPERFLERSYSPYEFLPFGGGTRKCPAANFSPKLLTAMLSAIVSQCDMRLADARPNPLKMHGVHMGLARRVSIVSGKIAPSTF